MEAKELLETKLNDLQTKQDAFIKKQEEEMALNGKSNEETMQSIKALQDSMGKFESEMEKIATKQNRLDVGAGNMRITPLLKAFQDNKEAVESFRKGNTSRVTISTKTDDDSFLTQGGNEVNEVVQSHRLSGVFADPLRRNHIREFMTVIPTQSNAVSYVQETNWTTGAGQQTEGDRKGVDKFTLTAKTVPVKTVATTIRLSKDMLEDGGFVAGFINTRGSKKLRIAEDAAIITGTSSSSDIKGITQAGNHRAYSTVLDIDQIAYHYDVLINAIAQANNGTAGEYQPNLILLNPTDYWNMVILKAKQNTTIGTAPAVTTEAFGGYVFPEAVRTGSAPAVIGGAQLVANTAIASDKFLVGDFQLGATLAERQGLTIELFYEDRDNVPKNLVTVRIEERIALPVHSPNAFIYGNFTDAFNGVS